MIKDRKTYKNPPLIETVFELFYTANAWTPAIPGQLFLEIQSRFPIITQQPATLIGITETPFRLGTGPQGIIQFKSSDSKTIVQLTDRMLTVNKLPKYYGWESFIETITFVLNAFSKAIGDVKYDRIGLRTINKIDIGTHSLETFMDSFKIYPNIPQSINPNLNSIQLSVESTIEAEKEVVAININTLKKEQNFNAPVLFQIHVLRMKDINSDLIKWLEHAHEVLYTSFTECLTEECKIKFDNE